ncbi:putative pentatricopeptide repeat-containing protein At1g03510 [Macadamia integrifolia]|uniref:putative pentatricopeptide repeat-containing protein At1g03510 n=1 Tax=Macadamia integrifolia TaxID=60698 RepID=UPI001C4FCC47|nr:putative pentatricopeptide repeat-containing protein At1g03510 [Macadamia integrifolia]
MGSHSANHQRLLHYTKLLTSHVNQGRHEQALILFRHMNASPELSLDPFVFPLALKSCAALNFPHLGTTIHAHTTKSSLLSNPFVACALVDMYGKCVSVSSARRLFDEIPQRNVIVWNAMISLFSHSKDVSNALHLFELMDVSPDASSFNSIIAALSESDDGSSKALAFYRRMQDSHVKPTMFTLLALLPACVDVAALNLIKEIHGYSIRNGIDSHAHLSSGLVEAYGRCGCLLYAHYIFERMTTRDVVAWSAMISAYALHGKAETALAIFRQMELARVRPDGITFLGVFKACSHAGLTNEALEYFERMRTDYGVEVSSDHYSCLIDVLSRAGRLYEAYEVIKEMPVKATAKAWGAILGACRTYGEVELAKIAGRNLFEIEPDNPANYVLLATIYCSAGRLDEAESLRKEMKERGVKKTPGSSWVVSHD